MPAPYYRFELGVDLTPAQADENISYIHERIDAAIAEMTLPFQLSSITQSGLVITFHLSNATVLGTATLPVLALNPRGFWTASTNYFASDLFTVRGVGDYIVKEDFTSGDTFNPADTRIAFQRPDPAVQLPLYVDATTSALTVTRAEHVNRMLVALGPCDFTIGPDDWLDGDAVHFENQSGGVINIFGTTEITVVPPTGETASISTTGGVASAMFREPLAQFSLIGKLDAVST